eukprot:7079915-Karenia_brevis.AAC.1
MRARLVVLRAWQTEHERSFFYAGPGKGAVAAAWKQAAWAEVANHIPGIEYAIVLLDLIKAFDRIPYWYLWQQAVKYGYNLVLLRLSMSAYMLARAVGADGVYGKALHAGRGITAGSLFATIEMRLVMLEALDLVYQARLH